MNHDRFGNENFTFFFLSDRVWYKKCGVLKLEPIILPKDIFPSSNSVKNCGPLGEVNFIFRIVPSKTSYDLSSLFASYLGECYPTFRGTTTDSWISRRFVHNWQITKMLSDLPLQRIFRVNRNFVFSYTGFFLKQTWARKLLQYSGSKYLLKRGYTRKRPQERENWYLQPTIQGAVILKVEATQAKLRVGRRAARWLSNSFAVVTVVVTELEDNHSMPLWF